MSNLLESFKLPTGFEIEMNVTDGQSHGYVLLTKNDEPIEVNFRLRLAGFELNPDAITEMLPYLNGSVVSRRMHVDLCNQARRHEGVEIKHIYFLERVGMSGSWVSARGNSSKGEVRLFQYPVDKE